MYIINLYRILKLCLPLSLHKVRFRFFYCLPLLWFVTHSLCISFDGLKDSNVKAEIALIYGNKVNESGEMSERLKARVDKGLEVFRNGLAKKIIVSGGLGKESFYEAQVMKSYLLKSGVPDSCVIVDDYGNDTYASTVNFIEINKKYHFNSVIVVSQFYHISRAKLALKRKGMNEVYSAHADYYEWRDGYSLFREFFGYYKYLFI